MGLEWDPEGDRERSREGRSRLWTTIAIVAGIGVFGVSRLARHQQEQQHQRELEQLARYPAQQRDIPSYDPPAASASELDTTMRAVCTRLLSCGGLPDTDVAARIDGCVAAQTRMVTDDFSRSVVVSANKQVLAACGSIPCEKFADCYMDALQRAAGATTTATPVSAETRARLIPLFCSVVTEARGTIPDLEAPDASPKAKQLGAELAGLDPAAVADLMKEAIATCQQTK